MDEFLKSINSLYWWISVVIVGLVLNILASYFRTGIDKLLSSISTKWSLRTAKLENEMKETISTLANKPEGLWIVRYTEIKTSLAAIGSLLVGVLCMVIVGLFRIMEILKPGSYDSFSDQNVMFIMVSLTVFFLFLALRYLFRLQDVQLLLREIEKEKHNNNVDDVASMQH